jgi:hypothetical protein
MIVPVMRYVSAGKNTTEMIAVLVFEEAATARTKLIVSVSSVTPSLKFENSISNSSAHLRRWAYPLREVSCSQNWQQVPMRTEVYSASHQYTETSQRM